MIAALVSHLVKQGTYRSGDIAVITPYLGHVSEQGMRVIGIYQDNHKLAQR